MPLRYNGLFVLTIRFNAVLLEAMRHIEEDSDLNQLVDVGSESVQQHPVKDTREALEKLVTKMDNLEADFDKIAEKSSKLA